VFLEDIEQNVVVDSLVLGAAEFLAALFSIIVIRFFGRRIAIFITAMFIALNLGVLCILKGNKATLYTVTILTRAAL
jgi:hypothetical protein